MNGSDLWGEYAILQRGANRRTTDARSWAADETAEAFLDALIDRRSRSTVSSHERFLKNIFTNRAKKHRRRAALLRRYQHRWPASIPPQAHAAAAANEALANIKKRASAEELTILFELARGKTYSEVATDQHFSESALKSKISRCRRRLFALCA